MEYLNQSIDTDEKKEFSKEKARLISEMIKLDSATLKKFATILNSEDIIDQEEPIIKEELSKRISAINEPAYTIELLTKIHELQAGHIDPNKLKVIEEIEKGE